MLDVGVLSLSRITRAEFRKAWRCLCRTATQKGIVPSVVSGIGTSYFGREVGESSLFRRYWPSPPFFIGMNSRGSAEYWLPYSLPARRSAVRTHPRWLTPFPAAGFVEGTRWWTNRTVMVRSSFYADPSEDTSFVPGPLFDLVVERGEIAVTSLGMALCWDVVGCPLVLVELENGTCQVYDVSMVDAVARLWPSAEITATFSPPVPRLTFVFDGKVVGVVAAMSLSCLLWERLDLFLALGAEAC